ncbi:MAG: NUDIX domain-containing protein [Gemmatimonadales bacterium]
MLALRRALAVRSAGAWEAVHGHIESGENPVGAALRELEEETGCRAERFYNLSRVEAFYLHRLDQVALIPAFAARLDAKATVQLSNEHDQLKWVPVGSASSVFAWPREHRALADLAHLLREGDAGALEEVLRIER